MRTHHEFVEVGHNIIDMAEARLPLYRTEDCVRVVEKDVVVIGRAVAAQIDPHAALRIAHAEIQPLTNEFRASVRIGNEEYHMHHALGICARNPLAMDVQAVDVAWRVDRID